MISFFFRKTSVSLGVGVLSFVLIISFGFYAADQDNRIKELKHHLLFLNHQIVRSQEAAALMKAHEKDFTAFLACKFEQSLTLEMLQSSLAYPVEFGPASYLDMSLKSQGLTSQNLSFSVPCLQDREVFILLDRLLKEGPGFFQIHEVTISRISALSEEMLEKIAAGKPQTLFNGKVTATWVHR